MTAKDDYFESQEALKSRIIAELNKPAVDMDVKKLKLLLELYDDWPITEKNKEKLREIGKNLLQMIQGITEPIRERSTPFQDASMQAIFSKRT